MNWQPLVDAALAARDRAYAPYSRFRVGAALLTNNGAIVGGCNVENSSFGLTICAERVAVATAIALGHHRFQALVVASESQPPVAPCGLCRQTLVEFADEMPILLINGSGEPIETTLAELLPRPFRLES